MEERLYGWYPATYQLQATQVRKQYQNECLYKFRDTMYDTKPAIPPSPTLAVHGYSMRPPSSGRASHSAGTQRSSRSKSAPRAKSAPIPRFKLIPRLTVPTPVQCWEGPRTISPSHCHLEGSRPPSTASTQVSWQLPKGIIEPDDQPTGITAAQLQDHLDQANVDWPWPEPKSKVDTPDVGRSTSSINRIQSASTTRKKVPVLPRAIKSAGVSRTPRELTAESLHPEVSHILANSPPPPPDPPRPKKPVHQEEELPEALEWKEAREKYGWMAEVHGNPYGYKKIVKRMPYTVKVPEPVVDPEPPRVHMENVETFFNNTIPKRHGAFTIHQEWMSEGLHVKRMELQKKTGTKYRWRNYGFVY